MADSEHSEMIAEFCKVTGQDTNRARMYLEANGWKSDLAISSYFEEAEEDVEEEMGDSPPMAAAAFPRSGSPKPAASKPSGGANRIATFASLANSAAAADEEEGQAFYAGGSERSGQQVIGPGKRKAGNEVVEEMFKAVRKFGGEVADPGSKKGQTTKLKAFRGAGFVLGSTPDPSATAAGTDSSSDQPREMEIRLRLYRTGFTVNDQPLRDYNDPQSKMFLDSVRKGEVPAELMSLGGEGEISLSIEDHSHEEYVPRRVAIQAFSGTGFRLGNIVPVVAEAAKPSEKNAADAQEGVKLDESKPVTTVQIRLADGSRLIMKANHSHTVGDVRTFIVSARPEFSTALFSLMTAFPTKELTDDSATLEQENLLNSVIVQKMK